MTERDDFATVRAHLPRSGGMPWAESHDALDRIESALADLRAQAQGGWKPLWNGELLAVDEGTSYLFAVELADGWEYFQDAIVWDAETDPDWSDAGHGWSLENVTHFRLLPTPPEAT